MKKTKQFLSGTLALLAIVSFSIPASAEMVGGYNYANTGSHTIDSNPSGCRFATGGNYVVYPYSDDKTGTAPVMQEQVNGFPVVCMREMFWVKFPQYGKGISVAPEIPRYMQDMNTAFASSDITVPPAIPDMVVDFNMAFNRCLRLSSFPDLKNTSITTMNGAFSGNAAASGSTELPDTVVEMYDAFSQCTGLTSFPDLSHMNSLKNARSAFRGCSRTTGGTQLPTEGVLVDMDYMFEGCAKMTEPPRVIPQSVTSMRNTFKGCTNLSGTIDVRAPPKFYTDTFSGAASVNGAQLVLNYTAENETIIDSMIASKPITSNIVKGKLLDEQPPVDPDPTPDHEPTPDPDPNLGDGEGMPVPDGSASQDVIIRGVVEPINTIDVDIPLNLTFTINENRNIFYTKGAKITSNSPAPLVVSSLGVTVPSGAPQIVPNDTFPDWNRLSMAQTKNNLAVSINGANLSTAGVKLGEIGSGFNEPAVLPLGLSVLYGKLWPNTSLLTFDYIMNLEIALAN